MILLQCELGLVRVGRLVRLPFVEGVTAVSHKTPQKQLPREISSYEG